MMTILLNMTVLVHPDLTPYLSRAILPSAVLIGDFLLCTVYMRLSRSAHVLYQNCAADVVCIPTVLLILPVYTVNVSVSDALRDQHKWTSLNVDSHLRTVYQQACLPVLPHSHTIIVSVTDEQQSKF